MSRGTTGKGRGSRRGSMSGQGSTLWRRFTRFWARADLSWRLLALILAILLWLIASGAVTPGYGRLVL